MLESKQNIAIGVLTMIAVYAAIMVLNLESRITSQYHRLNVMSNNMQQLNQSFQFIAKTSNENWQYHLTNHHVQIIKK